MTVSRIARACFVGTIGAYRQAISPLLAPRCRFEPSCSEYAQQAIGRHGVAKGCLLAVLRLAKCHPFHPGGIDPVPRIYHIGSIHPSRPRN